MRNVVIAVVMGAATALPAAATTHYVSAGSATPAPPFLAWSTAAANIQDAVDVSSGGDSVLVSNGIYNAGGAAAPVHVLTNRVALTRAISVRSVNGPAVTTITGRGPAGPDAIRCVYLTNGAELVGFTLSNGCTRIGDGPCYTDNSGGGALLDHGGTVSNCIVAGNVANFGAGVFCLSGRVANCIIENNATVAQPGAGGGAYCVEGGIVRSCVIRGNSASYGAGAFCDASGSISSCAISENTSLQNAGGMYCSGGLVQNCTVWSNVAAVRGGGAYVWTNGTFRNTLATTNTALDGGGVYLDRGGSLQNCTLADNAAVATGGGLFTWLTGAVQNCIIVANLAGADANFGHVGNLPDISYSCLVPLPPGAGNIGADPFFADSASGDYRLQPLSPCLDRATNQLWMAGAFDLDGRPRIWIDRADLGAYELNPASLSADTDGDGMPDWWEWQYFAHVTNTTPAQDNDGDLFGALQEWIAGTDPTDAGSYFHVEASARIGQQLVVNWPSVAGRVYDLYRLTNLMQQGSAVLVASGIAGTPPSNNYTDQVTAAQTVIYKLDVRLP